MELKNRAREFEGSFWLCREKSFGGFCAKVHVVVGRWLLVVVVIDVDLLK